MRRTRRDIVRPIKTPIGAVADRALIRELFVTRVPQYTVADFSADWWVLPQVRLLGGVSNIGDRKYYSRVFQNGIEPALSRTFYVGAAYEF